MKPFLKWAGGKRALVPQILPLIPNGFRRYVEPMVGAGGLFFYLEPRQAMINDTNLPLITLYRVLAAKPDQVIDELSVLSQSYMLAPHEDREEIYYQVRKLFNILTGTNESLAAMFMFLNKTCFNGLWRVNQKGEMNVSWGKYKKPAFQEEEHLKQASNLLKRTKIMSKDFSLLEYQPGDFVYFDPPYLEEKDGSFTAYTKDGFGPEDHKRLSALARNLSGKGVACLISNSNTTHTREIYRGLPTVQVRAPRSINRNGDGRGPVTELLIANYWTGG